MKQKTKQLIMTLALLLTAVTGAWAQTEVTLANVKCQQYSYTDANSGTRNPGGLNSAPPVDVVNIRLAQAQEFVSALNSCPTPNWILVYAKDGDDYKWLSNGMTGPQTTSPFRTSGAWDVLLLSAYNVNMNLQNVTFYFSQGLVPSGSGVDVTWTDATMSIGSLTMPAGNVSVNVDYFAQAELAAGGAPTAIADVKATTDDPIVTAGTVANIGQSQVKQGTLMYCVKQTDDGNPPTAPTYEDEDWTEQLPTAASLHEGKAYVWYYIRGAEPKSIIDRIDANTCSDSDIMPLGTDGFVTLDEAPTYAVSLNKTGLADGEPALWSAKSTNVTTEVNLGEADLEGVKRGETVTVTYSNSKKIIGVKVDKTAQAAQTALKVNQLTTAPSDWDGNHTKLSGQYLPYFNGVSEAEALTWNPTDEQIGDIMAYLIYGFKQDGKTCLLMYRKGYPTTNYESNFDLTTIYLAIEHGIKIYYSYEPPIEVTPVAGKTKTGTFTQPGSDVVLTPIYAKTAAFATTGSGSEVTTLLPAAAEGVFAGTDAPLIVEGTVAFAGTSTEVKQGTVMYAVTPATATAAPALTSSDWKTTVPTAKDIADGGAEVKVWYYIQGADAPEGVAATLDNTFNNSDICATPIAVTVLSNQFDLTLNPANVNTIDATQASKGTVTVNGTDKTGDITADGKLKAVKMDSEVKLKANNGYKFRKVEVKKDKKTLTITGYRGFSTTLNIEGCTTWDEVIAKNPGMIKKDDDGDILNSTGEYYLIKGDGENKVYVNAEHPFDPNATDYEWEGRL